MTEWGQTLFPWLMLSLVMFSIGLYGLLTRRSAVGILIAVELMLNAGALNLVAFNRFRTPAAIDGQAMAVFVIALAAAEVLVALAILVMLFRLKRPGDVTTLKELNH